MMTKEIVPRENRQAWAQFVMGGELPNEEFRRFLVGLVKEFISSCDAKARMAIESVDRVEWNHEGGICGVVINGRLLSWCKMYLFDDTGYQKRGVLFRDHDDKNAREMVFLVADAFERFLQEKKVPFAIEYRRRTDQ